MDKSPNILSKNWSKLKNTVFDNIGIKVLESPKHAYEYNAYIVKVKENKGMIITIFGWEEWVEDRKK